MTNDAADRVESLRRRFAALADDDATALGQVEWQARRIAQRHGNDVEARALHIAVLARLGRRADGLAALEAALPLLPWATTPVTALRLPGAAIGFGRAAEATALLRRVLSRGAAFPPAAMAPADMDLLALVPLVAGDTALLADVARRLAGQEPPRRQSSTAASGAPTSPTISGSCSPASAARSAKCGWASIRPMTGT